MFPRASSTFDVSPSLPTLPTTPDALGVLSAPPTSFWRHVAHDFPGFLPMLPASFRLSRRSMVTSGILPAPSTSFLHLPASFGSSDASPATFDISLVLSALPTPSASVWRLRCPFGVYRRPLGAFRHFHGDFRRFPNPFGVSRLPASSPHLSAFLGISSTFLRRFLDIPWRFFGVSSVFFDVFSAIFGVSSPLPRTRHASAARLPALTTPSAFTPLARLQHSCVPVFSPSARLQRSSIPVFSPSAHLQRSCAPAFMLLTRLQCSSAPAFTPSARLLHSSRFGVLALHALHASAFMLSVFTRLRALARLPGFSLSTPWLLPIHASRVLPCPLFLPMFHT
uniref:Leucine-rich repeat-containing protein 53 n=1 Tax=Anthurium amnicola TaxID=1678845 RepID=A0A1D1Y8J4_9ARAE